MKKLLFIFTLLLATVIAANAQEAKQDSVKPKKEKKASQLPDIMKVSEDADYGYSPDKPVKVGMGANSSPGNQHLYLQRLHDAKGKPVKYERKGSCCPYPSKNALFGDMALVDRYEVIYKNEKGRKKKAILYISFYDYEEPMIPKGFQPEVTKRVGF